MARSLAVREDCGVRLKFATSPWWVQGAVHAIAFGTIMTIFSWAQSGRWLPALLGGSLGALLLGIVMSLTMSRMHARLLGGLGDLEAADRREVARAARRGLLPSDPGLRASARDLLQRLHDETVRSRRLGLVTFSAAIVIDLYLAVTWTPWWGLAAFGFAAMLISTVVTPARYRRRLAAFDRAAQTAGGDVV